VVEEDEDEDEDDAKEENEDEEARQYAGAVESSSFFPSLDGRLFS
jgi:hypothetical protein